MKGPQVGTTLCFRPYTLEQALEGLAKAGFKNVEIAAVKGWLDHLKTDEMDDEDIDRVRETLDSLELQAVGMSFYDQLITRDGIAPFKKALYVASALGMTTVNTFTFDAVTAAQLNDFFSHIQEVADLAKALGVTIALETDGSRIPTASMGVKIIQRINHPQVKMVYDPGNVACFAGADPHEDIKIGLPYLAYVHLKDQKGGKGVPNFPALGDGELDFPLLMKTLDEGGYTGPISMEIQFDERGWPSYEECVSVTINGKQYWDDLAF